ncbi:MAG TPA: DUF6159 family protein [Phycisphaerae bacterium]
MFQRIGYTWQLMGASWSILKQDKKLLIFPLLSGLCCILVIASFAAPVILTGFWTPPARNAPPVQQVEYYTVLFLFYFCNYLVITFFNAAMVFCAFARMEGRDPSIGEGLSQAVVRLPLIIGWSLLAATVGLILRLIEDRSEKVGSIVSSLLGMAFSVVSFLVVPVLVVERKGPIAALKESTKLLRGTWGDQLVGNFSFGTIFTLLAIPGILTIFLAVGLGAAAHSIVTSGMLIVAAVLYLIALSLVQSALQVIFQTALYLHARAPEIPHPFPAGLLADAVTTK